MLDDVLKKVEAAYNCCPAYTGNTASGENDTGMGPGKPCFERQVNFLSQLIYLFSLYALVIELSSVSQKEVRHKVLMKRTFMEQSQNSLAMPSQKAFYRKPMQRV